jgi:hypothetical protein
MGSTDGTRVFTFLVEDDDAAVGSFDIDLTCDYGAVEDEEEEEGARLLQAAEEEEAAEEVVEEEEEPVVLSLTASFNVVQPTALGSVYFGEYGCLADIEPHFDETGLTGVVLQSREEHVKSSIACTLAQDPTVGTHVP